MIKYNDFTDVFTLRNERENKLKPNVKKWIYMIIKDMGDSKWILLYNHNNSKNSSWYQ